MSLPSLLIRLPSLLICSLARELNNEKSISAKRRTFHRMIIDYALSREEQIALCKSRQKTSS
jgi:hypothetical protein